MPEKGRLYLFIGLIGLVSSTIIGGSYLYKTTITKSSLKQDKDLTKISLPLNPNSPAIKYSTLSYVLKGEIISVAHQPESSSSAITFKPDGEDKTYDYSIPWNRQVAYYPKLRMGQVPKVQDLKKQATVELTVSYDLKNNTGTVGQVLILEL